MICCPSRKELIAFAQFAVAILSLWNYYIIDLFDTPMYDLKLFEHRCVSVALCFASFYYSLGTWLWHSKLSVTRMFSRIHCILVYLTLVSLLCISRSRYIATYGPLIRGVFSHEIFDDEDDRMARSLILIQGIMILSAIIIVVQLNYVFKRLSSMWEKRNRSA
ncbi:uncharacterized protein LOC109613759 [Musca domestica]|uniref:Uncharacterized protein LOC109613759 n=1 Tax=Musca domestica TaxID=7370 RepID=A0A9J7DIY7_MUSDO|nr:uncharacterized protein LOC109613759 [Musca domestica]